MKYSFRNLSFFSAVLIAVLNLFSNNIFPQNVGEKYRLNINSINLPFNNRGLIADVLVPPGGAGGIFDSLEFLFASGFMLSGYKNDSLWANGVISTSLVEDYLAGTIDIGPNDPRSALYKVREDDPAFSVSWQDWIDAVDLGADFYDGDDDGVYDPVDKNSNGVWDPDEDKPDILGDETLWCVYNDGVPKEERRWNIEPIGIEIRQTIFAFETAQTPLSNVIFVRYRIVNTGTESVEFNDALFSLFADGDIGNPYDDLGGCDTIRNASFEYNDSADFYYGNNPPCFMIDLLAGPVTYIPGITFIDNNGNGIYENGIDTPLDTAYSYRGNLGVYMYVGATNLGMTSGVCIDDSDPWQGEPADIFEARSYMQGMNKFGEIVDPCTYPYGEVRGGVNCSEVNPVYWYSGNPVSDSGWIHTYVGSDPRFFQNTGTFDLIDDKQVEIIAAFIVGSGSDALNSINVSKSLSDEIQEFYEDNFGYPIIISINDIELVNNYNLSQNFPNPFNPSTTIKYEIPEISFVTLKIFDVLGNEVATLVNEEKPIGSYEVEFNPASSFRYPASGIYFYQLKAGSFIQTKKMILIK